MNIVAVLVIFCMLVTSLILMIYVAIGYLIEYCSIARYNELALTLIIFLSCFLFPTVLLNCGVIQENGFYICTFIPIIVFVGINIYKT